MAERRPALRSGLALTPHDSREVQLGQFPLLYGRLIEVSGGGTTFVLARHGLGRRYRGGIVVAMDDAQWAQVVSPLYIEQAGAGDTSQVFGINVGGAGVSNVITVWVF